MQGVDYQRLTTAEPGPPGRNPLTFKYLGDFQKKHKANAEPPMVSTSVVVTTKGMATSRKSIIFFIIIQSSSVKAKSQIFCQICVR